MTDVALKGYKKRQFKALTRNQQTIDHSVYEKGSGAPIIVIQELPGICAETFRLVDKLTARGFKVYLPHLFGPIGKVSMLGNSARVLCMRKEFRLFQNQQSSPIVDWLTALSQMIQQENNGAGVGVIGMCLSGNFALAMMADNSVLAAAVSQPSLPLWNDAGLQLSEAEIQAINQKQGLQPSIMALRFSDDALCKHAKFESLDKTFNDEDVQRIELTELPGKAHSVLALDFVDKVGHPTHQAMEAVLAFFEQRLN